MQKWEYLVGWIYNQKLQVSLNAKGLEGWELITVTSASEFAVNVVFKRPVKD